MSVLGDIKAAADALQKLLVSFQVPSQRILATANRIAEKVEGEMLPDVLRHSRDTKTLIAEGSEVVKEAAGTVAEVKELVAEVKGGRMFRVQFGDIDLKVGLLPKETD